MHEKDLAIAALYDYYGVLLNEKQRTALEYYYNEDYSLAEIAENVGISRQGVRDQIKHAEKALLEYEDKLMLCRKFQCIHAQAEELIRLLDAGNTAEARRCVDKLVEQL